MSALAVRDVLFDSPPGGPVSEGVNESRAAIVREEDYWTARVALLLMASADAACDDSLWMERVVLNGAPPASAEVAARTLATAEKPLSCESKCDANGLLLKCSGIADPQSLRAHEYNIQKLQRGEGVIGVIVADTKASSTVLLRAGPRLVEISSKVLDKLAREYLILNSIALSGKRFEADRPGGAAKWTVFAGAVRSISEREVEEWFSTRERLPGQ
jgi:hypothetical protein